MIEKTPVRSITEDGIVEWKLPNGPLHREDGPAYECPDGYKAWYINGLLHREDGPAIDSGGNGNSGYYLEGYRIPEEDFLTMNASKYPKLQVYQILHQ
jgi:hypothetical protein